MWGVRAGAVAGATPRICTPGPTVHHSVYLPSDMITSNAVARGGDDAGEHLALRETPPVVRERDGRAPTVRAGSPLSRRPKNDTSSSSSSPPAVCPGSTVRPSFIERDRSHLPRSPAEPSQTFTARPPSPVPPAGCLPTCVPVPHPRRGGTSPRSPAGISVAPRPGSCPSQAVQVPPVAYSKAMYMSTDTGTSANVSGSRTLAPDVAGVWKMLKILMMFGWSRRFRTTTSRRTRRAASTVWSASGTRFSATTRPVRRSSALHTAPKDPQPRRARSRYRDPTFHVSTCPVSSFCARREERSVVRQVRGTRDARGDGAVSSGCARARTVTTSRWARVGAAERGFRRAPRRSRRHPRRRARA